MVINILLPLLMIAPSTVVYLLKVKINEAIEKFVLNKNEVENQLNKNMKVLRSDRGGEYESPFVDFCAQHGIIHETITPYSPQSNRVAKPKNHTLKEMMISLVYHKTCGWDPFLLLITF